MRSRGDCGGRKSRFRLPRTSLRGVILSEGDARDEVLLREPCTFERIITINRSEPMQNLHLCRDLRRSLCGFPKAKLLFHGYGRTQCAPTQVRASPQSPPRDVILSERQRDEVLGVELAERTKPSALARRDLRRSLCDFP